MLKWKFLLGKRNRRLDHLVHTLVERVIPYYASKQHRQDSNFEGPDIETRKRMAILKRAEKYADDQIHQVGDSVYTVASESQPARRYDVDIDTYTCSCLDFPHRSASISPPFNASLTSQDFHPHPKSFLLPPLARIWLPPNTRRTTSPPCLLHHPPAPVQPS